MTSNDILRRLRYALNLNNLNMMELFRLSGREMRQAELTSYLKKETEDGYQECSDDVLGAFLDGLILKNRGSSEGPPTQTAQKARLTNNAIFKKIRIALQLKDSDIIDILRLAHVKLSKSEVNALFRSEGQENFKPCGDQVLRNFLKGLTIRYREDAGAGKISG